MTVFETKDSRVDHLVAVFKNTELFLKCMKSKFATLSINVVIKVYVYEKLHREQIHNNKVIFKRNLKDQKMFLLRQSKSSSGVNIPSYCGQDQLLKLFNLSLEVSSFTSRHFDSVKI